jgi:hypothetical protein
MFTARATTRPRMARETRDWRAFAIFAQGTRGMPSMLLENQTAPPVRSRRVAEWVGEPPTTRTWTRRAVLTAAERASRRGRVRRSAGG